MVGSTNIGPTILCVGDVVLTKRPAAKTVRSVRRLLAGHDAVAASVEGTFSERGRPAPKGLPVRSPRDAAGDLRAVGIDVAALANNHTMDFGEEGLHDTLRAFDGAGLLHCGAGTDLAAATAPAFLRAGGLTVVVLSVASTLPPGFAAGPDRGGAAPLAVGVAYALDWPMMTEQPGMAPPVRTWLDETDRARLLADVAAARAAADAVVVFLHWGVHPPWQAPVYGPLLDYQQPLGRALIDAGADAVVGNHACELQGIELYQDRPIVYCPGMFWYDGIAGYPWISREAIAVRLVLARDASPGVEAIPLRLDEAGVPHLDRSGRTIKRLAEGSRSFGTTVVARDGRVVVRAGSAQAG